MRLFIYFFSLVVELRIDLYIRWNRLRQQCVVHFFLLEKAELSFDDLILLDTCLGFFFLWNRHIVNLLIISCVHICVF